MILKFFIECLAKVSLFSNLFAFSLENKLARQNAASKIDYNSKGHIFESNPSFYCFVSILCFTKT